MLIFLSNNNFFMPLPFYKAIDHLKFIPQEKEMLYFRQKLEEDVEFKKQYEAEGKKPVKKPEAFRISGPDAKPEQIVLGQNNVNQLNMAQAGTGNALDPNNTIISTCQL